ncbi:hypothetical protein [uncultured Aquimarina sp.]|uniref:hypothetical protein n=1 Tax=uncultured Aquimarina sp. TaxID=575652 RepID=UPI0026080D47|nr:hypothetical protein [uncultured Aquimarina sp.]
MIYLIILLTITHLIVLYKLRKYLDAYKKNNHNYITNELKKINQSFYRSIDSINKNVTIFSQNTESKLNDIEDATKTFTKNYRKNFHELTSFIKSDYQSLTALVKETNTLLESLLQRTEESIAKNQELKPLLIHSHEALEKLYGKSKLLISGYEKSLKLIQNEMENTVATIENTLDTKIRHIATKGEKAITESLEISKNTVHTMTDDTNAKLKTLLQDNQIQTLVDNIQAIEKTVKTSISEINTSISELDQVFITKLNEYKEANKDKKGFFGF